MDLCILRHGIAAEPDSATGQSDARRPLTSEGKRKLRHVARALNELELTFDLILSSPYTRAIETAEFIADELDLSKAVQCTDHLLPGGNVRKLVETINGLDPQPACVLLVGHEPYLSQLISLLITGDSAAGIGLKKAGFARLSTDSLKAGKCACLEWLLTPAVMRLVG